VSAANVAEPARISRIVVAVNIQPATPPSPVPNLRQACKLECKRSREEGETAPNVLLLLDLLAVGIGECLLKIIEQWVCWHAKDHSRQVRIADAKGAVDESI
jgi:hypothetical protein